MTGVFLGVMCRCVEGLIVRGWGGEMALCREGPIYRRSIIKPVH